MPNLSHFKVFSIIGSIVICFLISTSAVANVTTVYLVRHAEKQAIKSDPPLTPCGTKRAQSIAKQLSLVNLNHIFSSHYKRTIETAIPTSIEQNVEVEFYDPKKLNNIAEQIIQLKGNILVVGHSNTTAVLAGILTNQHLPAFNESIYDRLYQVTLMDDQAKLQILQQNFSCSNNSAIK